MPISLRRLVVPCLVFALFGVVGMGGTAHAAPVARPAAQVPPICSLQDLTIQAVLDQTPPNPYFGGNSPMYGTLLFSNKSGHPCSLSGWVGLSMSDTYGNVLPITSVPYLLIYAPTNILLSARVQSPTHSAATPFIWVNWCGGPIQPPLTLSVSYNGQNANVPVQLGPGTYGVRELPSCDDPSSGSLFLVGNFYQFIT